MQIDTAERIPDHWSEEPELRRATNADRDQIVGLHKESLSEVGVDHDPNLDSDLEDVEGCYSSRGGEFLILVNGDGVAAMGGYRKLDSKSVELRRLRVSEAHQRNGYGRRLLRALLEQAGEQGFKQMVLDASEEMDAARGLFEAEGFELERKSEFFGVSLYFYRKLL